MYNVEKILVFPSYAFLKTTTINGDEVVWETGKEGRLVDDIV